MFKEINIGGYVLRFYPTDNKGWMCGITDEQLTALMSITTLFTNPVKKLTDEEILIVWTSSNFVRYTENGHIDEIFFNKFARAILRKAQEKC